MNQAGTTPRKPRWALKAAVLAAALILSLLLAEIGARFVLDVKVAAGPKRWYQSNWKTQLCQNLPAIGGHHRPNVRVTLLNEFGREIEILTDANGVRICDEAETHMAGPAIAVFGDSFVEAAVTPCPETFCAVLSTELGGRRVLNFGVGGYSTAQAVGLGELIASKYDIDLFILAVYAGNDLRDNYLWKGRRDKVPPSADFLGQSAVVRLFRGLRPNQPETVFKQYEWRRSFDGELLLYDPDLSGQDAANMEEAKTLSLDALRRFSSLAARQHAPAMIVLVPSKAMVYEEPSFITSVEATPWAYDAIMQVSRRGFDFDLIRSTWRGLAEEVQLPFLDLTDAFRENRNLPLYGKMDRHWAATGQKLAAGLVAQFLCDQQPPLPSLGCK